MGIKVCLDPDLIVIGFLTFDVDDIRFFICSCAMTVFLGFNEAPGGQRAEIHEGEQI